MTQATGDPQMKEIIRQLEAENRRLSAALQNARNDALEEAAKLASTEAERVGQLGPEGHEFWRSHEATAMIALSNLAAEIVALISKPTELEKGT